MDISPELKKRFATDCCIPIDIFTEPVFTSRLQLFDRFYNTIERYNVFLDMIKNHYTMYEYESQVTVTTHRKGNCTIKASSHSDPQVKRICNLTITDEADTDVVQSISLDQTEVYLAVGSSIQLYATLLPETLEDKRILWGTSDKSVATVSGGFVTALTKTSNDAPVIITAMSNKDKSKVATCIIHIGDPVYVTGLDFLYHQTEIEIGTKERLSVHAVPANATSNDFLWVSSNPAVATVDDGVIEGKAEGWCSITVSSVHDPDLKDVCYVLVHNKVPVSQIVLEASSITMIVGNTRTLDYEVFPDKATNKNVRWSSSDTTAVQVDPNTGVITAVGRGNAVVRVTSELNDQKYAECAIQVDPPISVRNLEIEPVEKRIGKDQQFNIVSTVTVSYDVNPEVDWESSNKLLALVSEPSEPVQKSVSINSQDYYNDYDQVKCRIVSAIKASSGYKSFITADARQWTTSCTCLNGTAYSPEMDGHTMISIKIDKSKFTPLYFYNPSIFTYNGQDLEVWENVASTLGETDNDHIIYSENLLNEVAECCNLSRIEAFGHYLLGEFYSREINSLIQSLGKDSSGKALAEMVMFSTDEIIIDTSKLTKVVNLGTASKVICTNRLLKLFHDISKAANMYRPSGVGKTNEPFRMTVRLFTLYKLKTEYEDTNGATIIDNSEIEGYVKNIYFEGNQPIEFVGNDECQLPMLIRAMSYQTVQEDDRKFLHGGLVAQFTDDHRIYVPAITSIPDTSNDSIVKSEDEDT